MRQGWGEVYCLAWKAAEGDGREAVERCLQDWMHLALHCSSPRTHRCCLLLLHALHSQRKQPAVELMLARLYEPLLLRALSAPHPLLRQHAVSVLVDTFPLPLPLEPRLPPAVHLQQQLNQLCQAMQDAAVGVRVVSVRGCCQLLGLYWEAVGVERAADLLRDALRLAEDAAAAVRAAVCDGLRSLLSCHPCHGLLRRLLPGLGCLLHDRSASVQQSYALLLLALKPLRDLTFYSLSPLPSLLLALQHATSGRFRSSLCQLLANSFFPAQASTEPTLLVRRLLVAVRENGRGARVLYAGMAEWEEGEGRARLVLGLLQLLARTADAAVGEEIEREHTSRSRKSKKAGRLSGQPAAASGAAAELDAGDAQQVEHVVVILASVWQQLDHDALQDTAAYRDVVALFSSSPALFERLLEAFSGCSSLSHAALLSLLPQLPSSSVSASPTSAVSLSALCALSPITPSLAPVLDCLVQSGRLPQLLLLSTRSIRLAGQAGHWTASRREKEKASLALEAEEQADRQRRQQDKQRKRDSAAVAAAEEEAHERQADIAQLYLDPTLCIRVLSHLLSAHRSRALLLSTCTRMRRSKKTRSSALVLRSPLLELLTLLDGRLERLTRLLRGGEAERREAADDEQAWLSAAAELLLKARIHLHGEERERAEREEQEGWETAVAAWPAGFLPLLDAVTAAVRCLPATVSAAAAATSSKRSRPAASVQLPQRALPLAVELSTDLLALGFPHSTPPAASSSIASCLHCWLTELSAQPSDSAAVSELLPALYKLMLHLSLRLTSHPAFSAAAWQQQPDSVDAAHSPSSSPLPCSYALYADSFRLLSSITRSASEALLSSLTAIAAAFRCVQAERLLLSILVHTLPFVAAAAEPDCAPLLLACQLLSSSPLYLAHLPSLLLSALQQARAASMQAQVMHVFAALLRQLVGRLELRLKEKERRTASLSLMLEAVRGMTDSGQSDGAEEQDGEVEAVRDELEQELLSRWKASGGRDELEAEAVVD